MYVIFISAELCKADLSAAAVDHTSPAVEALTPNQVPPYALEISSNDFNYAELFCDPEAVTPELLGGGKCLFSHITTRS